jgi:hypothetical protein
MNILEPDTIMFESRDNGYLRLTIADAKTYDMTECRALFPLTDANGIISVVERTGSGTEEIGLIESTASLSDQQRKIIEDDISRHYFTPEIISIEKIESHHWYYEWFVTTNRGEKSFYVRNLKENLRIHENGMVIITDLDKCRYQIDDYRQLPPKSASQMEKVLL